MHQGLSSTFVDRYRSSLGRHDPAQTINDLVARVVSETLPTGNLPNEAAFEKCFREVISSVPGPKGTRQFFLFGIPIRLVAEIAAVALEDAVAFTAQLHRDGSAASTRGARKYHDALRHAEVILSILLDIESWCMAPARIFGSFGPGYPEDSAAVLMQAEPRKLVTELIKTSVKRLKLGYEAFEAARARLFAVAFMDVGQCSGPLAAVQWLYHLSVPDNDAFESLSRQMESAPGGLNAFVERGFIELYVAADHAFNSGDAQLAGSLWDGARGLCALAAKGEVTIARIHEDLPFASEIETRLNAAGDDGKGRDLTTWMLLGNTICRTHTALAMNEYSAISGALGRFERVSHQRDASPALFEVPAARIDSVLKAFGFGDAVGVTAAPQEWCRHYVQKRLNEAVHAIASAAFGEITHANIFRLKQAMDDLISYNVFWRYSPADRSEHGAENEAHERRRAWHKAFKTLSNGAVTRVRQIVPSLITQLHTSPRAEFLREMQQSLIEHAKTRASRSKEPERLFC